MPIELTPIQQKIMQHQLDDPEIIKEISEDLTEDFDYASEQVTNAIGNLKSMVIAGVITELNECEKDFLEEYANHNTWLATKQREFKYGEISNKRWESYQQEADDLAEQFTELLSLPVTFRHCLWKPKRGLLGDLFHYFSGE